MLLIYGSFAGPAHDERGVLPNSRIRAQLGIVLTAVLFVAPTYRREMLVDPSNRTLQIRHRILWHVPMFVRTLRFEDISSIERKSMAEEYYGATLRVGMRVGAHRIPIMFRHDVQNFPQYTNDVDNIARLIGVSVHVTN